jgi:hypothetical protein
MRRALAFGLASAVLFLAAAPPAAADGRHRRHGHHHHHHRHNHGGVFLGLNFGVPVYPRYHAPPVVVYQAPPVIYRAPPVYEAPPSGIALGREVGQGCREYTSPVIVGGQRVQGYGIACPRPDGSWQIVQ